MKYEIVYTENKELWKMTKIAESHGYTKTQDCYWVQIFEDTHGNHIVMTRDDENLFSDPCKRLAAMLEESTAGEEAAEEARETTEQPMKKEYTNTDTHEKTENAVTAMAWHRAGHPVSVFRRISKNHVEITLVHGAKQPERNADDENRATCKHIAHELEAYADGHVYRCPECGEIHRLPATVGDKYRCPHCHNVADVDDFERLSVYDFLSDVYDIEYRIGSDSEYRSVKIMVACGGPNIYIDTAEAAVKLYWWSDRAEYPISYDARDAIDQWAEELWGCR